MCIETKKEVERTVCLTGQLRACQTIAKQKLYKPFFDKQTARDVGEEASERARETN